MITFDSVKAFHADRPAREFAGETDFGCHWTFIAPWPQYRLTYNDLGELFTVNMRTGQVNVLAVIDPTPDEGILGRLRYNDGAEAVLAGWADYDTARHELTWVAGRIDAAIAEGKARLAVRA